MKKVSIILAHAFVGWMLCDLTMVIGMSLLPMQTILVIHAIAAPIYFIVVSLVYFNRFNYTKPLPTAMLFIAFVMVMDFLLVGLVINKSLEMFTSVLGTWLPFTEIFIATWLTGLFVTRRK